MAPDAAGRWHERPALLIAPRWERRWPRECCGGKVNLEAVLLRGTCDGRRVDVRAMAARRCWRCS
jgi:hypothetical protein